MSPTTLTALIRRLLAIFIALSALSTAHASLLVIGDPSFEGIALSPGGFTSGVYAANSWNSNVNAGLFRPTASSFPAGVPDGLNIAYSASSAAIDQVLTATLTANTTYTLSVNVGSRLDTPHNDGYTIQLLAGGALLSGTTSFPVPADGTFVLATDVYTAGAGDPHLGQALEIKLLSAATGQTVFDNVKLDATAVPEPASYLLLSLTAAGVGLCRRPGRNRPAKIG
jgi:hypothetical protein